MPTEADIPQEKTPPPTAKTEDLFATGDPDPPASDGDERSIPPESAKAPEPPDPTVPDPAAEPEQARTATAILSAAEDPDDQPGQAKVAEITIRRMKLADLNPHPRNPRKHPAPGSPQWEVLRRSLAHDYFDPIVHNDRNGLLVSGHFRTKVLTADGYTEADCSIVDYDEPTHLARIVAANRLLGEFDESLPDLAREIEEGGLGDLAGYDETELATLIEPPEVESDDEHAADLMTAAEKLQEKWKVQPGDLYEIGDHRLLCGDCAEPETWDRLLEHEPLDMVWIDPPYNVDYADLQKHLGEVHRKRGQKAAPEQPLLNDAMSHKDYCAVLGTWLQIAADLTKPGGPIYIAHAEQYGLETRAAMLQAGWNIKQCLIWVKDHFTLGRQDYQWQHEPILYGWKGGAAHHWQGGFKQRTVIDDEHPTPLGRLEKKDLVKIVKQLLTERQTTIQREARHQGEAVHPTIKPLPMVARHIWNSSRRTDLVGDFFAGSGTTLIAAEKVGRRSRTTELDPKFCAVILQRATDHGFTPAKIPHG